jgi:hypothetical protein
MFPVVAWLILFFFGKLAGFSMFSASAEAFGRTSERALPIVGIVIYFCAYVLFFVFFQNPVQIYEVNKNNIGGLHGYMDHGLQSVIFNPSENRYIKYPQLSPSLPASKFTDTFNVKVLYKASTSEYYNDTAPMSLGAVLFEIILGSLMLCILYIILFIIAKGYYDEGKDLTHRLIASRFHDVTGFSPLKALIGVLILLAVISIAGIISVQRIKSHYAGLYTSQQEKLMNILLHKVSPGDTVSGTVIRRFQGYEAQTVTKEGPGDRMRSKDSWYTMMHYTVEFRDLVHIPVYLDIAYADGSEEAKELDKLFADRKTYIPEFTKELDFTVNEDYSISLKKL